MTLLELAQELVTLGAVEAINLDGGGSTEMVAGGRIRNSPSDRRERPVSDGILIFSINTQAELLATLDQLARNPVMVPPSLAAQLRDAITNQDPGAVERLAAQSAPQARRILAEAASVLRRKGNLRGK